MPFDLVSKQDGKYQTTINAALPGGYTYDVTVVHTPYQLGEWEGALDANVTERPYWHVRNLLLVDEEASTSTTLTNLKSSRVSSIDH